jgi:predicted DCC family thiol-disulfide oxidoreductase YuxK
MDSPNTLTEDTLQTMLVRTAVMQAQQEAILAALKTLQEGQDALRKELAVLREAQAVTQTSVAVVQNDVAGLKERMVFYATKADVESVRSELYKALEAQTWRLLVWMTAVSSGLVGAVYYIARNVH